MCGIVGYIGEKNATPLLINALKKLEYRGYDSAGVAVYSNGDIIVQKAKGALKELEKKIAEEIVKGAKIEGNMGIGHTRWATHGEPCETNAHPHINESGTIAVVHNGIIENYSQLKAKLQEKGIVFRSQTDTEVVAHLVNFYYEETKDLFKAVRKTVEKLEGSYALGVLCKDYPDRIIATRKESPLIVGLGKGENFIASDVPAVLEHTREVYFLEQKEMAVLYADHVDLFNADGGKIVKEPFHVDWDADSAEKGGFEHFMLKEIYEQPKALTDTMRPRIVYDEKNQPADIKFDEMNFGDAWKNTNRIVITACGTAYHAGVVAKYAFEHFARIPVAVDVASEYRYRNPIMIKDAIFIVISQSGETADTLAAMRLAKESGAKVIAITNCVGSTVSREADEVIYTWAGPEIAVASTKAYTTQLACIYLLAMKVGKLRGALSDDVFKKALAEFSSIPAQVEKILSQKTEIQKFAALHFNKNKIFYIGRLFDAASSLESALKLKEVSYMHSEAFSAGELKHGPIALVDPTTLVVGIATQKELYDKLKSNIEEVKTRKAATLVITQDKTGYFDEVADTTIVIPEISSEFGALTSIVPAQLLAYYCAIQHGNDPDKPRNLAKSVTVE